LFYSSLEKVNFSLGVFVLRLKPADLWRKHTHLASTAAESNAVCTQGKYRLFLLEFLCGKAVGNIFSNKDTVCIFTIFQQNHVMKLKLNIILALEPVFFKDTPKRGHLFN
jgi:hypothetical protein